ncbi:Pex25 protein [Saccharomycopsis crataegensis]|uniref:Pex25 protein n=1 Tax=Saccharomycopsis crataegensis TaxID=43959 RepID=A0AAV5QHH9_9ASCO|nr:Pex25 protein [Saccharomycopsis crataegensis]
MSSSVAAVKKAVAGSPMKRATTFAILQQMVGSLAGKNSIGKFIQYLLKFLLYYSASFQNSFLSKNKSKISQLEVLSVVNSLKSGNNNVSGASAVLQQWLALLVSNPIFTINYAKYHVFKTQIDSLEGCANGLSLFRQTLRFGKTPFRLTNWCASITQHLQQREYGYFTTDDFAVDTIDLTYGIVDELGLLFKLKYYNANKQPRFKRVVAKLDEIIWMADIVYQLKMQWQKLQKLKAIKYDLVSKGPEDEKISVDVYVQKVNQVNHDIEVTQLALAKSCCDFGFDAIDLFSLGISKYIYYLLGVGSGFFNTAKTWKATKRELEK